MKVFWTKFALNSLSDIFEYYRDNVGITIACSIRDSVLLSANQLQNKYLSGPVEELLLDLNEGHRYLVRGNYKIIYKIEKNKIFITDVFDTRRDPDKLKK
jgi:toxin ParE1/3/4